ncbi:MarR family transcriptional regulator [Agromyces sp. CFH 90414]|uniref:MarR family transcriptional regulator n=1 Tax=Agromyces agglutinans TaxID=2662258 RepID=A0A6I2F647_9MICO|nr:MarR family transcriptional regulator [Agromyces agglutinans]MRG59771.1 MarR family transcriptional regulator [Agromyces agglutinans]
MDASTLRSQRLALALHRATAIIDRAADDYLRPAHDIGISIFAALVTIDALGPASQRAIADGLDVSRSAVTQRLAELDRRGLVRVVPDPGDQRANLVELSDAGRTLLAEAWHGLARHDDGLEEGVDLEVLQAELDRFIANGERRLAARKAST